MDRWQYLMVLLACLLLTAPLEFFGRGVYRRPRRVVAALLPVAAVFLIWDVVAAHLKSRQQLSPQPRKSVQIVRAG